MLLLIPSIILFTAALALFSLRLARPDFRFSWLIGVSGSILTMLTIVAWQPQLPILIALPSWLPADLLTQSLAFSCDRLIWPFAIGLAALNLAILLTAGVRDDFPDALTWSGVLTLSGLALLAVTAANPLTLVLIWTALDIAELITQLWSVNGAAASERVVVSFSTRVLGSGLLIWVSILSAAAGNSLDFASMPPQSGLLAIAAAGLRLGVFPLHTQFASESSLRHGFGTALRLIPAASSLVILARVSVSSSPAFVSSVLLILAAAAALYGGWFWLRAPDELIARPYWIIGLAALAVFAALTGNPEGAVAWSAVLILAGGALFVTSVHYSWLSRTLLLAVWGLLAFPYSLTASVWQMESGSGPIFAPFFILAQALLTAGFVRHALRPGKRDAPHSQPAWTRSLYPAGIGLLLLALLVLGMWGWDGAFRVGSWPVAFAASILLFGLLWSSARLRILRPVQAHWVRAGSPWPEALYRALWRLYQTLGRFSAALSATLEGEGGLMWTLLFLVLFVSLMSQAAP